ncbi:hypothetical protein AB0912_34330 [Streptomyces sp. NPDC007084]|uniref:hypothetical protein n=1 Tax=Streptomyces sp. NPDC007084 TaxID=3154313 RepID=UPI003455B916
MSDRLARLIGSAGARSGGDVWSGPLPPRRPVGHRCDGRPIYPILGASSEDETNDQLDDANDDGEQEQQVTLSQDRLGKMLTREKSQGERAAFKRLLSAFGFENPKALTEFVTAQREAEQAALSEVERPRTGSAGA